MMDYQKELKLFLDYYVSDQSSYIRDSVELDKSFHVINVPKLLAVSGLAESYVFRLKDSWNSWLAAKAQAVLEKDAIIQKLSDQLYAQEMKTSGARVLCETACELLDGYAHQDAMVIINDLEQAMKEPAND